MDEGYLRQTVQSADVLVALEPEEFGALIVEAIRRGGNALSLSAHVRNAFYPEVGNPAEAFPVGRRGEVQRAVYESWSWLEAQGFLIWPDDGNGRSGFRVLSRRAQRVAPNEYPRFAVARAIPQEILHESIRADVWGDFVRGRYGSAVFHAARQIEISVRAAAGLANGLRGVDLMRRAFDPQNGPLTDMNAETAEREARAHLFAGFYGAYRNPVAHRDIDIDDPIEAMELVMTASHLLRIVEARVRALAG